MTMNTILKSELLRVTLLLLLTLPAINMQAQTASFNFSAGPAPVTGWTNMAGDPSAAVITGSDAATGISISSISPSNWIPLSGIGSAYDGEGSPNGVFFPAGGMLNHWFQFTGAALYNSALPQLQLRSLNPGYGD